jgi:ribosomal protein S18 acetylase RimI-like enzyme
MRVEHLTGDQVAVLLQQFVAVYRAAFAPAPYHREEPEVAEFARALPLHTRREGFRAIVAFDGDGQEAAGIAYGYRSQPGQWWYDNVSRALGDRAARLWLADAFQVTEVAVLPERQRQGIGTALMDHLLGGRPYPRAVLSTLDAETAGRQMYRARGWQDLLQGFYFPGVPRRYAIMGRVLQVDTSAGNL